MIFRIVRAAFLFSAAALAAPPLTTIQDVLYKADGTRFNGLVIFTWMGFEAPDTSNIASHSTTVEVTNGNLRVQLVPTVGNTPVIYYSVKYNSDGRVQFTETWAVPENTRVLRVRDVRIPAGNLPLSDTVPSTILESDVLGLSADLASRPFKAPGFAVGRTAFINLQGALDAVAGPLTDCVLVDGSSAPCGAGGTSVTTAFADSDTPLGIVDGANRSFSLSAPPIPASSLSLFRNGMRMKAGLDFTLSDRIVGFVPAATPQPGDTLLASYRLSAGPGDSQFYPGPQVLCSGTGGTANTATLTSLGTCVIPANLLASGNRVEIRYDLAHQGSNTGFHFEIRWGATTVVQRDAAVGDVAVSGRSEVGLTGTDAQVTSQSFGTVLPFQTGIVAVNEALSADIAIEFSGKMSVAGADTLALRNFTVIRFP